MTVIACNLKEMAADSYCHEDDDSYYMADKLKRLADGSILGGAGNHPEFIMEWIERGKPLKTKPVIDEERDDFAIIHLTKDGLFLYCNSLTCWKLKETDFAVGCGAAIALYCMRVLKMSPKKACEEAMKIDRNCGGDVDVMQLAQGK